MSRKKFVMDIKNIPKNFFEKYMSGPREVILTKCDIDGGAVDNFKICYVAQYRLINIHI
jgi:hypothetical protein